MQHSVPTEERYKEVTVVLDNHQGEHHLAVEFHAQLRRKVQHAGKSLLQFSAAIDHLAHLANVDSTEQHMSREAARAIAEGLRE
jgi:PleD family two-component response regulator